MATADERRDSISVCLSVSEESKISNQMSHPNLWQLAQRGNVSAIATLPKARFHNSITVKASLKDGCLKVMLESAQVPGKRNDGSLFDDRQEQVLADYAVEAALLVRQYETTTNL